MKNDIAEPDAEPMKSDGISNYVLLIIYALTVAVAILVAGSVQLYRSLHPETPAEQLSHAIDALHSGDDLIARRALKQLAVNGNADAEYWLADLYEQGLGTPKNMGKAVSLLNTAAANGSVPAQVRLGEIYLSGIETDPDYDKALDILGKAAATGSATAQRLLGQMYAAGLGTPGDPFKAAVYYTAAIVNGDRLAAPERDRVVAELSPEQGAKIPGEMARLGLVK